MAMLKHYTIPIFTPEMACPFRCVFCNQQKISGHLEAPDFAAVHRTITAYLQSFKVKNRRVEVGFFGGTFTGIPVSVQEGYLSAVQPFLKEGTVQGIRLSTRPDYIDASVLNRLKRYGVTTIELGAQSLDDEVLRASRRGHTANQVKTASAMIRKAGFRLGLQMMIGLPGDTLSKALSTADTIILLGAADVRIYPALVIRDTVLHRWFRQGRYHPLSLEEAVAWSKALLLKFEDAGIHVIRLGLHPSEGLLDGSAFVAGPFHLSFRELVLTEIWHDILFPLVNHPERFSSSFTLSVPVGQINYAIGYHGKNKKMLQSVFPGMRFCESGKLSGRAFTVS